MPHIIILFQSSLLLLTQSLFAIANINCLVQALLKLESTRSSMKLHSHFYFLFKSSIVVNWRLLYFFLLNQQLLEQDCLQMHCWPSEQSNIFGFIFSGNKHGMRALFGQGSCAECSSFLEQEDHLKLAVLKLLNYKDIIYQAPFNAFYVAWIGKCLSWYHDMAFHHCTLDWQSN